MLLCSATTQPGVVFRRRARVRCAVVSCSSAESSPSSSFRTLLSSCGADLGACYDGAGALQVGPARKALKAASTAARSPLAAAAPPQLLAALGCAASQALAAQPCALPWVGSPEPGDGVASAARRLVDCFLHGVEAPAPRLLDASLLLLAFALAEERALGEDAACVATSVGHALAGTPQGSPPKAAVARLLAGAPPRSASAARADEQARYAELAEVKAAAAELNARASEKRRLARGDWKCAFCATVNFSDRRVCYACLQPPEEEEPRPAKAAAAAPSRKNALGVAARAATGAAASERLRRKAGPSKPEPKDDARPRSRAQEAPRW